MFFHLVIETGPGVRTPSQVADVLENVAAGLRIWRSLHPDDAAVEIINLATGERCGEWRVESSEEYREAN